MPMNSLHPVSDMRPPERTIALWQDVRYFIGIIWSLFGGPETIAALRNLQRKDHQQLACWLRRAETLVRKLLLIEAAELSVAESKRTKRKALTRAKPKRIFNADEPHQWRVSFKLCEGDMYPFAQKKVRVPKTVSPDARFPEARPLAERFEALLRVFDAPECYVARAARLLRRCAHKIMQLTSIPQFVGFDEIFEPLRPLLCGVYNRFRHSDTS